MPGHRWQGLAARCQRPPRRAQALVEFALVSTILALLAPGVVDFGRSFYYDVTVSTAAMEGARAAASGGNNTAIQNAARDSAPAGVISTSNVTVTPSACSSRVASPTPVWVTVQVSYSFTPFSPYMKYLIGNPVTFTRSVSQRMRVDCA